MKTTADLNPLEFCLGWMLAGILSGLCWNYALMTSFQQNFPWYIDFILGLVIPPVGLLFALLSWAFDTFGQFPVPC